MDAIIIEDHGLTRDDFRQLLKENGAFRSVIDFSTVAAAMNGSSRLSEVGMVLIDHGLISHRSNDEFRRVRTRFSSAALVVVSGEADLDHVAPLYRSGVMGYLPKTMSAAAIRHAIGLIMAGERFIPAFAFDDLEDRTGGMGEIVSRTNSSFEMLTDRQREILKMVAKGAPNKVIARSLDVHEVTIKSHLRTIYRALGVARRTEAARLALLGGIEGQSMSRGVSSGLAMTPSRYAQPVRLLS